MKRKILIFALCCTLLLGVFSVSAFAEEDNNEYYLKSWQFNSTLPLDVSFTQNFNFVSYDREFNEISIASSGMIYKNTDTNSSWSSYKNSHIWEKTQFQFVTSEDYQLVSSVFYYYVVANSVTYDGYVVEVHDHSYTSSIIAPTCTEKGYTSYICECGDIYTDNEVAALGHSYSSTVVAPTCTDEGFTIHTCSNCGDSYTDSETAVIPHNYTTSSITPPTCTEKGGTSYVCSVCSHTYTEGNIDALGHNYSSSVIDPTCTEEGFTSHTCLTCGDVYTDNTVAPLGHSYSSIVTAPTCTKEGYTTHICSVCNDKLIDTKVEALGHTFDEKMCTVCRAPNPDYYVRARDFASVISNLGDQLKVGPVVSVLVLVVGSCVGLVFMWCAVRKLVHAYMSAFKKGKISL